MIGNAIAADGAGGGIIAGAGSCLNWVTYSSGGPTPTLNVSGLHGGAGGWWTLGIAVFMLLSGLYASLTVRRLRALLVVVPALAGAIYTATVWGGPATLPSGTVIRGAAGAGLVLTLSGFIGATVISLMLLAADWRRK
jgi:hypothetical protein